VPRTLGCGLARPSGRVGEAARILTTAFRRVVLEVGAIHPLQVSRHRRGQEFRVAEFEVVAEGRTVRGRSQAFCEVFIRSRGQAIGVSDCMGCEPRRIYDQAPAVPVSDGMTLNRWAAPS
jgi:hypothetical protein